MNRSSAITPDQFSTFGELLKYLRRRAGLTQRELSIAVGYSDAQVSRQEQNKRVPDVATLRARFVPALQIEREPEWAERLVALAGEFHDQPPAMGSATTPAPRDNLPLQLTSFIGRERERVEVRRRLSTFRLVTLTGSGGSGKTRLALQVAAELLREYPDGVWLVELAPLSDPGLVPNTVAATLGAPEGLGLAIDKVVTNHVRAKRLLLLLDNREHLIEAAARLVETVLRVCPNVRILATSREALGVAGESVWRVPSLGVPDATGRSTEPDPARYESVRLFVERAAAALPDFELMSDNAAAVAQVCRRLDGLPLAIELAAARVKSLRVEQIAERLDDRFGLLTGGNRTALPRQQTLRAAIDWSHDLLSEPERVLLRRLAVFAGGWTLEAATAVCADNDDGGRQLAELPPSAVYLHPSDTLDLLTKLVDKSLVVARREQGMEARYQLPETIRAYALDRLAESGNDEARAVRWQHATFFMRLAEAAEPHQLGAGLGAPLEQLETEHNNLRAALAWALDNEIEIGLRMAGALWLFWYHYAKEGQEWAEAALELAGASEQTRARAKALHAAGFMAWILGDYAAARTRLEMSVQIGRALGPSGTWHVGLPLIVLGRVALAEGNYAEARALLEESVAICRALGPKPSGIWRLLRRWPVPRGSPNERCGSTALRRLCSTPSALAWTQLTVPTTTPAWQPPAPNSARRPSPRRGPKGGR